MGENEIQKTLFEAMKKTEASSSTPSPEVTPFTIASPKYAIVSPEPTLASPEPVSSSIVPAASASVSTPGTPPVSIPVSATVPAPVHTPVPHQPVASALPSSPVSLPQRPLTREEQKKVFDQMNDCKNAVRQLRDQLISLNDKKRAAFLKKDAVSQKIRALIGEVKAARGERDKLTHLVKDSKVRRGGLNDEIRVKIEEAKKLNKEKNELIQKHKLSEDPSRLKKEIDELEYKIETEAPSPAEEKQLMKIIKEKKKIYEQAKGVSTIFEKINAVSTEIDKLKHKCDETHKKIQNRAAVSQEKHQEMLETFKGLDDLRAQEKEAGEKYFSIKTEFDAVNEQLQAKLMELGQLQGQVGAVKKEVFHERRKKEQVHRVQEHATLTQKKKEIEQKLKQKKKLTTEDLITLQG